MRSRLDYVKERLRLLYVGITRGEAGFDRDVEFRQAGRCDAVPAAERVDGVVGVSRQSSVSSSIRVKQTNLSQH